MKWPGYCAIYAAACWRAGECSAITIGIALEARFATRSTQPDAFRVIDIGLLLGLTFCWLRAGMLARRAARCSTRSANSAGEQELPWTRALGGLPSAVGAQQEEWAWTRAHLLLGAARLARYRAHSPIRGCTSPPPASWCGR